jgi:hypothetical protein
MLRASRSPANRVMRSSALSTHVWTGGHANRTNTFRCRR